MSELVILFLVAFILGIGVGIISFWEGRPNGSFQYLPVWIIILCSSISTAIFMVEIVYGNILKGVGYFIIILLLQYIFDSYYKKKELARIEEKNRIFQEQAALEAKKIRKQREKFEKEIKKVKEDQKIQNLRTILDIEDEENKEDEDNEKDFELKEKKRKPIPQNVKDKVWRRDEGKCVSCGSNENLEFDHIIPHSKGGADTYRNLQLLCEPCNRKKSDKIG